ncbi:MAG: MBOAT family protein [Oscillospiraceae bacterium]|nr:MBOAT family protein [Oscillospiraceae bacterium]
MQFTTVSFLLFAAVVLIGYYLLPQKVRWMFLLAASWVFYLCSGIAYLGFIALTTVSTYGAAVVMARNYQKQDTYLAENKQTLSREEKKSYKAKIKRQNRVWMILCLVLNFSLLAVCKFCLAEPFRSMAKGGTLSFLTLGLPLGISFYMFQSVGYVVDVYRATVPAQKNFFKFALFVSYFPQLIQGPISKFSDLAPQLFEGRSFDGKQLSFGLQRLLWGFFKKLVIADRIAVAVVALKAPEFTGVGFFLLTVFYAVQIYADFTGGIDMALGLSQALGIKLEENFIRPFFSKNIAEYWRRWHITLGEWMKSYIFYPISVSQPMLKLSKAARTRLGNFGKRLPVYAASVATWVVTGVWHGITPNFILWGLMNCFVIVVSEELAPLYEKFHNRFGLKNRKWYGGFEILRMFVLMNLIRIVDLFPDVGGYFARMGSLLSTFNFHILWDGTMMKLGLTGLDYGILLCGIILMFALSLFQEKKGSFREAIWDKPVLRYSLMFVLLLVVLLMGSYGIGYNASNFIYNQF